MLGKLTWRYRIEPSEPAGHVALIGEAGAMGSFCQAVALLDEAPRHFGACRYQHLEGAEAEVGPEAAREVLARDAELI